MYLQDIYTVHANLTGNPAISIPVGKDDKGLPFGLQIISDHFCEKEMFDYANLLTQLLENK